MGLDLTLLPFDGDRFSQTALLCNRRRELFEEIIKLPAVKVPKGFNSYLSREGEYEESHYGVTTETPYGEALTFVEVESLTGYRDHPAVIDNALNRAVWAYLGCLEPRTKVALFWH